MKLWPIFLFAAAGVGFAIVAKKTGKPSGTATVGGTDYRTSIYSGDGGFYAGPFASETAAMTAGANWARQEIV